MGTVIICFKMDKFMDIKLKLEYNDALIKCIGKRLKKYWAKAGV